MTTPVTLEYTLSYVPDSMICKESGLIKESVLQKLCKGTSIKIDRREIYSYYTPISQFMSGDEITRFRAGRHSVGLDSVLHEVVLEDFKVLKTNIESIMGAKVIAEYYCNRLSMQGSYVLYDETGNEASQIELGSNVSYDGLLADEYWSSYTEDYESGSLKFSAISQELTTTISLNDDAQVKVITKLESGVTSVDAKFESWGCEYELCDEHVRFFDNIVSGKNYLTISLD